MKVRKKVSPLRTLVALHTWSFDYLHFFVQNLNFLAFTPLMLFLYITNICARALIYRGFSNIFSFEKCLFEIHLYLHTQAEYCLNKFESRLLLNQKKILNYIIKLLLIILIKIILSEKCNLAKKLYSKILKLCGFNYKILIFFFKKYKIYFF